MGVSARVTFPQYVNTNFNVYTTHVVFTNREWFETFVGQFGFEGGFSGKPNVGFWCSWTGTTQTVIPIDATASYYRTLEIKTSYNKLYGFCSMVAYDVDVGKTYYRGEFYSPRPSSWYVTLVQEQSTWNITATDWAFFRYTRIFLAGQTTYVDWNKDTAPAAQIEDVPMDLRMVDAYTYDFDTRCSP